MCKGRGRVGCKCSPHGSGHQHSGVFERVVELDSAGAGCLSVSRRVVVWREVQRLAGLGHQASMGQTKK